MSQERILEMLSNDSYLQVKNTAKSCKKSTPGSKSEIIMRLKSVITWDEEKFNKFSQKCGAIQEVGCHFHDHMVWFIIWNFSFVQKVVEIT